MYYDQGALDAEPRRPTGTVPYYTPPRQRPSAPAFTPPPFAWGGGGGGGRSYADYYNGMTGGGRSPAVPDWMKAMKRMPGGRAGGLGRGGAPMPQYDLRQPPGGGRYRRSGGVALPMMGQQSGGMIPYDQPQSQQDQWWQPPYNPNTPGPSNRGSYVLY